MSNFSVLYPRLRLEALGAPPALMDIKIRDAARMFMRETPAYRASHPNVTIIPQTGDYLLPSLPADSEMVRPLYVNFLETVAIKARPLFAIAEGLLRADYTIREGGLKYFTSPTFNTITLVPVPDENVTGSLQNIVLQLRPSRTATTIDDAVLSRWEEEIMVGAQWLLYDMQDQPWTNKAEARRYKLRFTKAWTDARRELDKGFARADLRVQIPEL